MAAVEGIPPELSKLITSRLLPSDRRSLCAASSTFGQQPCGELITRLALTLPDLDACRQHQQQKRVLRVGSPAHRLSHVTALTISSGSVRDLEAHEAQLQLVLFVALAVPPMLRLTTLSLHNLAFGTVVTGVAGLGAACPQLTQLRLQTITHDPAGGEHLADLWAVLATVRSLRRLKVCGHSLMLDSEDNELPGLGAMTQLHSLSLKGDDLRLQELSQLVGLSKLTLGALLDAPEIDGPHLSHLTRLQRLNLHEAELSSLTALPHLTSLRVKDISKVPSMAVLSAFFIATHTQLVRLSACSYICSATDLLALPLLRELQCCRIVMPPAGAPTLPGTVLAHVRVIKCLAFMSPTGGPGGAAQASQCVAQTFPLLTALKHGVIGGRDAPQDELWPAIPAGRLLRLHFLSTIAVALLPSFARCAVALEAVVVKPRALVETDLSATVVESLLLLGPQLRKVELRDTNVEDATLIQLASSWPRVEEVTIRGNSFMETITDMGLSALLRLPHLRRVTLVNCPNVTPSAVAALAARWSVEYIEVCACTLVGAAEVERIWRLLGRPQLEVVQSGLVKKLVPWAEGLYRAGTQAGRMRAMGT